MYLLSFDDRVEFSSSSLLTMVSDILNNSSSIVDGTGLNLSFHKISSSSASVVRDISFTVTETEKQRAIPNFPVYKKISLNNGLTF